MENAMLSFILIPAAASIILPFAARLKPRLAETIAGITFLAGLINIAFPIFSFSASEFNSIPSDCMALFISGIIYFVSLCLTSFAASEIEPEKTGREFFFSLLLLMAALLCGTAISQNFFTSYIYIEIIILTAAAMLAISRKGTAGLTASSDWFFLTLPPAALCIAGTALLFLTLGNLSFDSLKQIALSGDPFGPVLFATALLIIGLIIKASILLMPQERSKDFRSDLPASGHIVIQLARFGIMFTAFRIAALLRFSYGNAHGMAESFIIAGAILLLAGALAALQAKDLKRMACFADFSNAGAFLIAIGINTPLAILAALFLILSNTMGTMLLLICGGITERKKTRALKLFQSQGPLLILIGGMSQAGLPPFAGFWSRLLMVIAFFDAERPFAASLTIIAGLMLLSAALRQRRKLFAESQKGVSSPEFSKEEMTETADELMTEEEIELERKKQFLLDPLGGNGEKWLKLLPAWLAVSILMMTGILFPLAYMYLHMTARSFFL
ncbi:MAG: hypothetical protein K5838_08235 [Elusimicrobiales bacterium]|nr:hypothetical protein [Elusimicrobiales bacterium]